MRLINLPRWAAPAAPRRLASVITVCVATVGIGACGSSSSSSSATTPSASSTATLAAATNGHIAFPVPGQLQCGATATSDDPCKLPAAPPAGKHVRIGFFGLSNNSYTDGALAEVQKVAASNNASVTDTRNPFDPAAEVRQVQDALAANKFDAYILEPENPPALLPLFKQMIAKGIPVTTFVLENGADQSTGKLQMPGQTLSIVTPPTEAGQQIADGTVAACQNKNPCNVAIIRGTPVLPFDTAKLQGLTSVLATHPNIKVVGTVAGQYSGSVARTVTENLLTAHPNINVIASMSDQMSVGAEQAIKAAGKSTSQILIASSGAGQNGLAALRAGRWYSSGLTLPGNEGYATAIAAIAAARGVKLSLGIDTMQTRGSIPLVPSQSNKAQWAGFSGDWSGV
jgi:ribose transport system substrate-binding protein